MATGLGTEMVFFSPAHASATSPGAAGSISGGQHDAIALQYTGGGRFIVLSHGGTFAVQ